MTDTTGDDQSRLGVDEIRRVLEALDGSDWDEALITVGDVQIAVARNGGVLPVGGVAADAGRTSPPLAPSFPAPPAPASPTPAASEPAPAPAPLVNGREINAPSVGVFWRAPEPGAAPFVEVGTRVAVGDTLGIVEVMKLMSHVDAPVAGTVAAIHADNAQSVEHGEPLFTIVADEA